MVYNVPIILETLVNSQKPFKSLKHRVKYNLKNYGAESAHINLIVIHFDATKTIRMDIKRRIELQ